MFALSYVLGHTVASQVLKRTTAPAACGGVVNTVDLVAETMATYGAITL